MDLEEQETPPNKQVPSLWTKMLEKSINNVSHKNEKLESRGFASPKSENCSSSNGSSIKKQKNKNKKILHPRTPNGSGNYASSSNCSVHTAASCTTASSTSFHLFSASCSVIGTPPAKRFQRVRNPFEAALTERLHLPLIGSPSLFQRPATPQMSSTQFEWTIEEVSSLKPANVEPHETQFHDSPDPDYEAKAQSAIKSYFKEQQIVPSPVDCPLRKQRIILSELNGNTPIAKSGRRIRDCSTQTALTLPPVLPAALEAALLPYFQPHLAIDEQYLAEQRRDSSLSNVSDSNKDVSLRRKLFDIHSIMVLDNCAASPTVHSTFNKCIPALQYTTIAGKLSDSDKSSFGSLSPISTTDNLSFTSHSPTPLEDGVEVDVRKTKIQSRQFLLSDKEELSPIHPPVARTSRRRTLANKDQQYRNPLEHTLGATVTADISPGISCSARDKFTPDRSSSPMPHLQAKGCSELSSIESSFNYKVSRLVVNSSNKCSSTEARARSKLFQCSAIDMELPHDTTEEMLFDAVDDDDLQVSQLSGQSSSSQSDTPRHSQRRSASRKNLSQSFSTNWLEEEEEKEENRLDCLTTNASTIIPKISQFLLDQPIESTAAQSTEARSPKGRVNFYRTDSGFNDLTNNSCTFGSQPLSQPLSQQHQQEKQLLLSPSSCIHQREADISMVCCSTPSKYSRTQANSDTANSVF